VERDVTLVIRRLAAALEGRHEAHAEPQRFQEARIFGSRLIAEPHDI
jgi:hypothetical protein